VRSMLSGYAEVQGTVRTWVRQGGTSGGGCQISVQGPDQREAVQMAGMMVSAVRATYHTKPDLRQHKNKKVKKKSIESREVTGLRSGEAAVSKLRAVEEMTPQRQPEQGQSQVVGIEPGTGRVLGRGDGPPHGSEGEGACGKTVRFAEPPPHDPEGEGACGEVVRSAELHEWQAVEAKRGLQGGQDTDCSLDAAFQEQTKDPWEGLEGAEEPPRASGTLAGAVDADVEPGSSAEDTESESEELLTVVGEELGAWCCTVGEVSEKSQPPDGEQQSQEAATATHTARSASSSHPPTSGGSLERECPRTPSSWRTGERTGASADQTTAAKVIPGPAATTRTADEVSTADKAVGEISTAAAFQKRGCHDEPISTKPQRKSNEGAPLAAGGTGTGEARATRDEGVARGDASNESSERAKVALGPFATTWTADEVSTADKAVDQILTAAAFPKRGCRDRSNEGAPPAVGGTGGMDTRADQFTTAEGPGSGEAWCCADRDAGSPDQSHVEGTVGETTEGSQSPGEAEAELDEVESGSAQQGGQCRAPETGLSQTTTMVCTTEGGAPVCIDRGSCRRGGDDAQAGATGPGLIRDPWLEEAGQPEGLPEWGRVSQVDTEETTAGGLEGGMPRAEVTLGTGAEMPLVRWRQREQRAFEEVQRDLPRVHSDWWHRPGRDQSDVFREEVFLCQVVPEQPQCSCPRELVYQIQQTPGVAQWMQKRMDEVARTREFTGWGVVRWHSHEGTVEEAHLHHCELLPLQRGEARNERAVLWGAGLQLAVFGAAPVKAGVCTAGGWQLVVVERMATLCVGEPDPRRRGRPWFSGAAAPLAGALAEVGVPPNTGAVEGEAAEWGLTCRDGPALAANDGNQRRHRVAPKYRVHEPVPGCEWQALPSGAVTTWAVWNAKVVGRQLCSSEGGRMLRHWLTEEQPDFLVIPEAGIPTGAYPRSRKYAKAVKELATEFGYVPYWAQHYTGQAKMGIAVLVSAEYEVLEVICALDIGEGAQWEGRTLAIRMAQFWVLAVYMPHNTADRHLLMAQVEAWMERQQAPVVLLSDVNAVLDPLEHGIRVCTPGCVGQLPENYFAREDDDWEGRHPMLTRGRHEQTRGWLQRTGFEDLDPGGAHTTYFRARFALRPEDAALPTDPELPQQQAAVGRVHQRRQQVVTARIDGVFLSAQASTLFEVTSVRGGVVDSEGERASVQRYREFERQGLGSDHVPLVVQLRSRREGVVRRTRSPRSIVERVSVLVLDARRRLLGLVIAARDQLHRARPVRRWAAAAGVLRTCDGAMGVAPMHWNRRFWQRTARRAQRVLLLRYWHVRHLRVSGALRADNWPSLFRTHGLEGYCEAVDEVAQSWPAVQTGEELQPRISSVVAEAWQFRIWSTTACCPRRYLPLPRRDERVVPRLCPGLPMRTKGHGWIRDTLVGSRYVLEMLRQWLQQKTREAVLQWRLNQSPDERRPAVCSRYMVSHVMRETWELQTPADGLAVEALLRQCRQADGFDWDRNRPWRVHRATAGWAETMVYVRSVSVQDPPAPLAPLEELEGGSAGWQQRRLESWTQVRAAAVDFMALGAKDTAYGDLSKRQARLREVQERAALRWRLRSSWQTREEQLLMEVRAAPAALAAVDPTRAAEIREQPGVARQGRVTQLSATDADGAPAALIANVNAAEWGLQGLSGAGTVNVPAGQLEPHEQRKLHARMVTAHQDGQDAEQGWFADCRKKLGTGSGLTYTAGHVRVAGAPSSQQVWCDLQMWDQGSDFNVVSGPMLARMLGTQWRDFVVPLECETGARMATGQVSRAVGTVVLEMDWTVAPPGHQLTQQDLASPPAGCWDVVRIPVRFVVFPSFEMPLIFGMPMIASMTAGYHWPDYGPAAVHLYTRPQRSDGVLRSEALDLVQLPLRMLRSVTPRAMHLCVTDKAGWIPVGGPTLVATRVVGGSELPPGAWATADQGWVPEGTAGATWAEIRYQVDGAQHHPALYSSARRFVVASDTQQLQAADILRGCCSEYGAGTGAAATVSVLIQGVGLQADEDAAALRGHERDSWSPWVCDEAGAAPLGGEESAVYLPAGTPVAWLEPRVVPTPEVQRVWQSAEAHGACWGIQSLGDMMDEQGDAVGRHERTPVYSNQACTQYTVEQTYVASESEARVQAEYLQPFQMATALLRATGTGAPLLEALEELRVGSGTVATQGWAAQVLHHLVYLTTLAGPPVVRQRMWGAATLLGRRGWSTEQEMRRARALREQLQQSVQSQGRARMVLQWLRDPERAAWMRANERGPEVEHCIFRDLRQLCGIAHAVEEPGPGYHKTDRRLASMQGYIHGLRKDREASSLGHSELDTSLGWGALEGGPLAERLCVTQEPSDAAPSVWDREVVASLEEVQAAAAYVEERMQSLQEDAPQDRGVQECTERLFQLQHQARGWALTAEEKEAVAAAAVQREELAEKLRTDSAFSNPLESVLENPITIPRYMASSKHIEQEEAQGGPVTVNCNEVMSRLTDNWQQRIREACAKERPRRGKTARDPEQQVKDQEQRVSRFAGYVASVSLFEFTEVERDMILELILELEGFFNCDPNVPPEWTGGEPYSGLRLRNEHPPIQHQERRVPPLALPVVLQQIRSWLETGIVEPSTSPHSSPLLIVAKKPLAPPKDPETGKPVENWKPKPRWRICVDYKAVNSRLEAVNMTNAPRLDVCLHQIASCGGRTFRDRKLEREGQVSLEGRRWLATTCDLVQGFHQITLAPECRPYTAFTVPGLHSKEGHLQFVCAPFGLSVMPTYFHEMVGRAIGDLHYGHMGRLDSGEAEVPVASHYIDDTFVSTLDTFKGHLDAVRKVFLRLQEVGFGARVDKVEFAQSQLQMLGWSVEEGRIRTDQKKAHKLMSEVGGTDNRLHEKKDVMSALGALNFYRSTIPNAAGISAPLYQLTRKGAFRSPDDWTPVHSAALRALKEALLADHFLAVPQEHEEFYLITDASVHSGAAVLAQVQPNGAEHPVSYAGTSFPEPARRWSPSERECFTLLWGADYFDQYLKLGKAVFCTDHNPLIGLAKPARSTNSKLARWSARLAQWSQATVVYRAGVLIGPADMLSRLVYPAKEDTPDTRESLQVNRGCFEPLENTDMWDGTGTRLFGLPMQRLSMLKPPTGAQWLSAEEAFRRATREEQQAQPPLHTEDALAQAAGESKDQFQKRRDWFQNGTITPEVAVKIMDYAQRVGLVDPPTAQDLGDGTHFVTRWRDTRQLDAVTVGDDPDAARTTATTEQCPPLEEKILVWREFKRTTVADLIWEATGHAPEVDEVEYVCAARSQGDQSGEFAQQGNEWHGELLHDGIICNLTDQDAELTGEELRSWLQETGIEDADGVPRDIEWCFEHRAATADTGHVCQVSGAGSDGSMEAGTALEGAWEMVRQQALQITRQQCQEDGINGGVVPEPLVDYITALCDPQVCTIVCQGGPGTGKTYTATMVSMLMLGAGLATKLQHTRPLVSSGGAGVGFERGSMADKLQYWTKPTKQAAERVAARCGLDGEELMNRVEAWPIDRTRGLSVPAGEWMVADEMQNTQLSLYACMLTRAERGAKVVLCGDVHQCDLPETRRGGMEQIVDSWKKLQVEAEAATANGDAEGNPAHRAAAERRDMLSRSFRYVELDSTCQMRNAQNSVLTDWIREVEGTRKKVSSKVRKVQRPSAVTTRVNQVAADSGLVLAYSAYAGLDNFGCSAAAGCPGLVVVGGSEIDSVAREAFRRRHRFAPFGNQLQVPSHAMGAVYVATAGAPCVAYSPAGLQHGRGDHRGLHYEMQVAGFVEAQIPVCALEQVPECRQILEGDTYSKEQGTSPQDRVVSMFRKGGYTVPEGSDGRPGQLMRATLFGGTVDRQRLITIAVRNDVWALRGAEFRWPEEGLRPARAIRPLLQQPPDERYLEREPNEVRFDPVCWPMEPARAYAKWQKRGQHANSMGEWWDPDKIYSVDHPIPSPTARGNTRWYEHEVDGVVCRRRLSPLEVAAAMGVEQRLVDNLGERQAYQLVGNAVPWELGEAVGRCLAQLVVPAIALERAQEWLQNYDREQTRVHKDATDDEVVADGLRRQLMQRVKRALAGELHNGGTAVVVTEGVPVTASPGQVDLDQVMMNADIAGAVQGSVFLVGEGTEREQREAYARAQEGCQWCRRLRRFLSSGSHLPGDDLVQQQQTSKEAAECTIMDGLLYRYSASSDGPGLQLCTPDSLRDRLVRMCHQSPAALHPGATQMYQMLSRRHYWPSMRRSCEAHVRECLACQRAGRGPMAGGDNVKFVHVGAPNSVVAMDVVGPLGNSHAATARGNRYIITLIDWFTRYVRMFAAPAPTAKLVGWCLEQYVAQFGVPLTVLSDQAQYFTEVALREYEKRLGIKRAFVSAYRPAGNGLLERFHRTLGRGLKIHVHNRHSTDWDEGLELLCLGYNSMVHQSTGYSPFYLMHGYHPALPFDVIDPVDSERFVSAAGWVAEAQQRLNRAHALAYERMLDAAWTRLAHSKARLTPTLHPGDKVLVWMPAVPRGFVKKCTFRWYGPHTVTSEREGRSYWVRTLNKERRIHESRLRPAVLSSQRGSEQQVETEEIQQQFENQLDLGAAAGPGWEQMVHVIQHSDLWGTPLESTPQYREVLTYVFEGQQLPYVTTDQRRSESLEPRMDQEGDELNVEQQLRQAMTEATGPHVEFTAEVCSVCLRQRGWQLGHCSICSHCAETMRNPAEATLDGWTPPDTNRWYRIAQDRVEDGPVPAGAGWKVRKCVLCERQAVYVEQLELSQYCQLRPRCQGAETHEMIRLLAVHSQYIRWVHCYAEDTNGQSRTVVRAELSDDDAAPATGATLDDADELEMDEAGIPVAEIQAVDRDPVEDDTQYEVVCVAGNKIGPCQYLVRWTDNSSTWQPVTKLFGAAEELVKYWESRTGHSRVRNILAQRMGEDSSTTQLHWKYRDWVTRVCHGVGSVASEVAYVVGVQLTRAGHVTQSAWVQQLRKGSFVNSALFTVWVIPQMLCTLQGSVVLPLLDVRYAALQRLVPSAEWRAVSTQLVHHHRALAVGADVPFFFWHSQEQDEKWQLHRDGVSDVLPLSTVLGP